MPAKRPTTPFALLALLSLGPGTGYDLKRRAESSVGHFWSENYGQIYPALSRLEAEGLVTRSTEAPRIAGRPARHVYTLSDKGMAALKEWLSEQPRLEPFRSEMLLKLFFGNVSGAEIQVRNLKRVREEEAKRLALYAHISEELKLGYPRASGLPYWLMTLSYGRHRSQAIVAWIDETLALLATMERRKVRA